MKDLIRRILKESEDDEFDWVPSDFDLPLGDEFKQSDICEGCKIHFNNDEFIIQLDFEEWANKFVEDLEDYDMYYLKELLMDYRPHNDYDLDDDVFNYVLYSLNDDNTGKLNYLMNILGIDKPLESYRDNLSELFDEFEGIENPTYLISNVVAEISEHVHNNRWSDMEAEFKRAIEDSSVNFDLNNSWDEMMTIKIPYEKVVEEVSKGGDLTSILTNVSSKLGGSWSDSYYNSYDSSGSEEEVNRLVGVYLDGVIKAIQETPIFESEQDFLQKLKKLGFKKLSNKSWSKQLENPDSLIHLGVTGINPDEGTFKLVTTISNLESGEKKSYQNTLYYDQLQEFMDNYRLDI